MLASAVQSAYCSLVTESAEQFMRSVYSSIEAWHRTTIYQTPPSPVDHTPHADTRQTEQKKEKKKSDPPRTRLR